MLSVPEDRDLSVMTKSEVVKDRAEVHQHRKEEEVTPGER